MPDPQRGRCTGGKPSRYRMAAEANVFENRPRGVAFTLR